MSIRLMNKSEDYKSLGVNPNNIEMWEDQKRENTDPGHWEWWYFDGLMDDGTSIVVQFMRKTYFTIEEGTDKPAINFQITLPDGTRYVKMPAFESADAIYGAGKCDVHYGKNEFVGDLKQYHIYVDPIDGNGVDLQLVSKSQPYRPGTSYFSFNENDEQYYTWFCAVPKGEVTGTITVDGKAIKVHGSGYHDHQWGSFFSMSGWNHWTWARQSYDDYTLLLFDMTATDKYGRQRFPIAFVEDKEGNIVFEATDVAEYEVLEERTDEASGKITPKKSRYVFENDGKKLEYILEANTVLEAKDAYHDSPAPIQAYFDTYGIKLSYTRFVGNGTMIFNDGNQEIQRSNELIYEFMFPGISYK